MRYLKVAGETVLGALGVLLIGYGIAGLAVKGKISQCRRQRRQQEQRADALVNHVTGQTIWHGRLTDLGQLFNDTDSDGLNDSPLDSIWNLPPGQLVELRLVRPSVEEAFADYMPGDPSSTQTGGPPNA